MRAHGSEEKCPGESNCQDWEAAAGGTHDEREQNACFGCHLFQTKHGNTDDWLTETVNEIERVRAEQRAGAKVDLRQMSPLVWEGLIIWHQIEADAEAEHKAKVGQIFEALFAKSL